MAKEDGKVIYEWTLMKSAFSMVAIRVYRGHLWKSWLRYLFVEKWGKYQKCLTFYN